MTQATREAILIVNNTEWLWNTIKEVATITELAEIFRVHIAPEVRRSLDPECYNLRDIELSYFLENTEHKIGA